MIVALLALAVQAKSYGAGTAYFPLIANSVWTYSLSNSPGSNFVIKALAAEVDQTVADGTMIVPCTLSSNGHETGRVSYKLRGTSLYIVGGANGLPVPPRRVMDFTPGQTWDYQMDTNAVIFTDPIIVTCKTETGTPAKWLGTMRNILVCTSEMKILKGKDFDITQTSTYAEGIGLVKLVQKGHEGKTQIDSTQTLIGYKPGTEPATKL